MKRRLAAGRTLDPERSPRGRPVHVLLQREPGNPQDHNAIAAYVQGRHVGYLRREIAAQVAPFLDEHHAERLEVHGVLRGGWLDAPSVGCHIWIDRLVGIDEPLFRLEGAEDWRASWPPEVDQLA